jgi:hypothetical protein
MVFAPEAEMAIVRQACPFIQLRTGARQTSRALCSCI